MKKIILLGLTLFCGASAFAQLSVLKEAEGLMKNKKTLNEVVQVITPAFTNAETQNLAQTWYIPGKTAFNEFDNLLGLQTFGKLPENGNVTMGQDLLNGYDYMMKALALDSVADAKGKIKTKYSKDIIGTLVGHYNDFNNFAIELWNLQDYKGAYKSWGIYLDMSNDPLRFKGINVPADTLLSEIAYNQALAAWQADDLQASLNSFLKAKDLGYTKKNIYDYAISVASALEDNATIVALAREALPIYGNEDPAYISHIINDYIFKKEYPQAQQAILDAIAIDPKNPEYYIVLGIVYEQEINDKPEYRAKAKDAYKQAIEVDPENAKANYHFGRQLYLDAFEAQDKGPTDNREYEAYFKANVAPLLQQSATYLEKASQLNPEDPEPLKLLENVYYSLNDDAKLNDVQQRLKLI